MQQLNVYQENYTKELRPRQMILPLDVGVMIPENEPVRLLDAVLEELNYEELQDLYSSIGRKSAVPARIFFKLFVFAMLEGVFSVRKIRRQCEVNIHYKWLLEGYAVPSHMAFHRFFAKLTIPVLNDLFSQLMERIALRDSITFHEVFIDGTKFEANANKYTFVWKQSVLKHKEKLPLKLEALKMEVHKLTGIDTALMNDDVLLVALEGLCLKEHIQFVSGKGSRKHPLQRLFEQCLALRNKRLEYEKHLDILGDRNSYSKTDHAATFMRLKDDHMRNGQLKPAYNVQLAVHSEYIMGIGIFPNPSDVRTLIPFVKELEGVHRRKFSYIVADAGYDSYENLEWLHEHDYLSCIKPQTYELRKTKRFKKEIGRPANMLYNPEKDYYICAKGRSLHFKGVYKRKSKSGYESEVREYECTTCNRCTLINQCQRFRKSGSSRRAKRIRVVPRYEERLKENLDRMMSPLGISLRTNRSIQVEGAFGVLKQDINFNRLQHRGEYSVKKFLTLLALGFNIRKLHNRMVHHRIGKTMLQKSLVA